MDLSIIIPFFNAEHSIGVCIESLLNQGLNREIYEIVLINDGSTDGGRKVVEAYAAKEKNIRLVNSINKGVYAQRNHGLEIARGDYILFMDADDYLLNGSLGPLLNFSLENDLQLIGFQSKTTHERYTEVETPSPIETDNFKVETGISYFLANPNTRLEIWWYLIKREYLQDTGLSFYEGYYHADVPFTILLWIQADRVAFCHQKLHRYYQSPGSITRSSSGAGYQKRYVSSLIMFGKIRDIITDLRQKKSPYAQQLIKVLRIRTDQYVFFFLVGIMRSQLPIADLKKALKKLREVEAYPMKEYISTNDPDIKIKILTKIFNSPTLLKMSFRLYRARRKMKD